MSLCDFLGFEPELIFFFFREMFDRHDLADVDVSFRCAAPEDAGDGDEGRGGQVFECVGCVAEYPAGGGRRRPVPRSVAELAYVSRAFCLLLFACVLMITAVKVAPSIATSFFTYELVSCNRVIIVLLDSD